MRPDWDADARVPIPRRVTVLTSTELRAARERDRLAAYLRNIHKLPAVAGGFAPPLPSPAGPPLCDAGIYGAVVSGTAIRDGATPTAPVAPASRDISPAVAGSVAPHTRSPAGELVDPLALELGDAAVWGPSQHSANLLWLFALVLSAPIWVLVVLVLGAFNVRFGGRKS